MPAYSTAVPGNDGDPSIYQSYTVGQVRVIMTDSRAHRNLDSMPDSTQKSMLGTEQRKWLKQELLTASESHSLVIWVNPVPWIATADDKEFATADAINAGTEADSWGGYPQERADIANHIVDNAIDNLVMVSGDSHMGTIDDGENSNFSDKSGPGFPILHAAALDRTGSLKGGPYSHDQHLDGGQFGTIDIEDKGGFVRVTLTGMNWEGEVLVEHSVVFEQ